MELTFETYKKKTGVDLETDIRKEFTGDVMNGLLAFSKLVWNVYNYQMILNNIFVYFPVKVMHNPVSYFAEKLNESMKGSETDDDTLIRIIISRSEVTFGNTT